MNYDVAKHELRDRKNNKLMINQRNSDFFEVENPFPQQPETLPVQFKHNFGYKMMSKNSESWNEKIIKILSIKYSFPENHIRKHLDRGDCNYCTTTYYLMH